ncbi:MAG: Peptidase M50 [Candidatus Wolfebacteria bacterium GW2011_GWA2_42_10]|uniref:Peptidase M50 n=2 Tax=Candidatus Wolfeibacteriota TaxID=1752735 RepID=A0A0G0XM35_9BACT|nr:MAG: Peptidase M50 [Candidatus Wolfebacteria bacterium GW2011_GWB1_41_12]KKS25537.1 MAG: Peptidase M50 [Candidatus Wolfebacteria bacterium GW2011_GWA2_42_10]KKT56576.1 MAG: Peptidase M50 [Candidatus Wolfebacteria bacterium GW2011_GWA1_44_24]
MNSVLISIFQLIVLLFSVIIHEVSHGAMAYRLGDPTAKNAGRLSLNPLKHLDAFGSFLLPLMLFILRSPILFGWAKPVPFNPLNLKNPKRDGGLVGLAGPASNLSIAVIFGLFSKSLALAGFPFGPAPAIFFDIIVLINIMLAVFNLIPVPPLDGSKILFAFLPQSAGKYQLALERYGIFILLFFIFFGLRFISPIIYGLYKILGSGLL